MHYIASSDVEDNPHNGDHNHDGYVKIDFLIFLILSHEFGIENKRLLIRNRRFSCMFMNESFWRCAEVEHIAYSLNGTRLGAYNVSDVRSRGSLYGCHRTQIDHHASEKVVLAKLSPHVKILWSRHKPPADEFDEGTPLQRDIQTQAVTQV